MIQIVHPDVAPEDFADLLEGFQIHATWADQRSCDTSITQLIAPAEECEAILDKFEQRFGKTPGFQVALMQVEAVVPRPREEPPEEPAEKADKQKPVLSTRISREELFAEINEGIPITRVYVALTVLSSVVAAIGLLRNDVAIVIGAMVIAPLLTPNVAFALATSLGDTKLARKSIKTLATGFFLSLAIAVAIGILFEVDLRIPAIASRTNIAISDIALAIAAGAAGTFAFTTGLPGTLIGVMVAVALLPPLMTFGMLFGAGKFVAALNAFLLVATNVICINLAGVVTFLFQGVRPRTWWEAKKAKRRAVKAAVFWTMMLLVLAAILIYRTYFR
jgi:uncharacterized hydrophobic protein (TIGR00341 family)